MQTDIKKVLAYSTISQLGFMFVAIGVGAYGVAIFHLYTHAFFKACLFLGAGSVIHAHGRRAGRAQDGRACAQDPDHFRRPSRSPPRPSPASRRSRFFSKDEILWFALASDQRRFVVLFAVASLTALLTAFYMFRLLWLTFFGAPRMDEATAHHVHESPASMTGVLVVLAIGSAVGGFVAIPHYLEPLFPLPALRAAAGALRHPRSCTHRSPSRSPALPAPGTSSAATRTRAMRVGKRSRACTACSRANTTSTRLYDALLARPLHWISERVFLGLGDRVLLDGSLHGLAGFARRTAGVLGRVQTGNLQLYLFFALAGLVVALGWSWRHV